jgi:hypothetical protein
LRLIWFFPISTDMLRSPSFEKALEFVPPRIDERSGASPRSENSGDITQEESTGSRRSELEMPMAILQSTRRSAISLPHVSTEDSNNSVSPSFRGRDHEVIVSQPPTRGLTAYGGMKIREDRDRSRSRRPLRLSRSSTTRSFRSHKLQAAGAIPPDSILGRIQRDSLAFHTSKERLYVLSDRSNLSSNITAVPSYTNPGHPISSETNEFLVDVLQIRHARPSWLPSTPSSSRPNNQFSLLDRLKNTLIDICNGQDVVKVLQSLTTIEIALLREDMLDLLAWIQEIFRIENVVKRHDEDLPIAQDLNKEERIKWLRLEVQDWFSFLQVHLGVLLDDEDIPHVVEAAGNILNKRGWGTRSEDQVAINNRLKYWYDRGERFDITQTLRAEYERRREAERQAEIIRRRDRTIHQQKSKSLLGGNSTEILSDTKKEPNYEQKSSYENQSDSAIVERQQRKATPAKELLLPSLPKKDRAGVTIRLLGSISKRKTSEPEEMVKKDKNRQKYVRVLPNSTERPRSRGLDRCVLGIMDKILWLTGLRIGFGRTQTMAQKERQHKDIRTTKVMIDASLVTRDEGTRGKDIQSFKKPINPVTNLERDYLSSFQVNLERFESLFQKLTGPSKDNPKAERKIQNINLFTFFSCYLPPIMHSRHYHSNEFELKASRT